MLCNQGLNNPVYKECDREKSVEIVKDIESSVNNVVCVRYSRNFVRGRSFDREGGAFYFGNVIYSRHFLEELERFVSRSIPAYGDTYCNISNGIKVNAYALYNCHDLNQFANAHFVSKNYDKAYNSRWTVGTKMRGRTQCGRHGFAFPVACTRREFINFLESMLEVTREERMSLFKDGIVLTERVAAHYSRVFPKGNLAEPYSIETGDVFKGISMLSTIVMMLDAIHRKDYRNLGLLCAQQIEVISPIADYLGVAFADFKTYIVDYMHSKEVEIQADEEVKFSWINQLPGVCRQSPLVRKVIAFATFMVSASFVKDSSLWKYLMELIGPNFKDVSSAAFGSVLFGQVVWALWTGIKRMENFTDYESLLGLSKDGAFTEGVNEIKLQREGAMSDKEATDLIKKIDALLASRKGLQDSATISRMCEYLVKRKKEVMCFTADYKAREKPIVIWLNGAPGGGKTTLIEGLKNFLAVKDGVPRKHGDTIMYNIYDKFPAEMSHCYDSRYMEINDIPSDYSRYSTEGMVPLDVLLQQVVDTSPLTFQAAYDKGIIYNHLRYVFITSNHFSYKMSGEIEKLQRRLDDSIIFDISFKGSKSYGAVASLGSKVRNDNLKFTVLQAECGLARILQFKPTHHMMDYKYFIPYLERKIDSLRESRSYEHAMFNTTVCSCGLSSAHHLTEMNYIRLSARCDLSRLKDDDHDYDGSYIGTVTLLEPEETVETVDERELADREAAEWREYILPIVYSLAARVPNLFSASDMLRGDKHLCRVLKTRLASGMNLYSEVKTSDVLDVLKFLKALHEFDNSFTFELPTKVGDIVMLNADGDTISDLFYSYSANDRVSLEDVREACVAIAIQRGDDPPPTLQAGLIYVHRGLEKASFRFSGSLRAHLTVIRNAYLLPENTHKMLTDEAEPQSAFVWLGWVGIAISLFRSAPSMTILQMYGLWFKLNVYFVLLMWFYNCMSTYLVMRYGRAYAVREYVLNVKLTNAIFRIQKFIFDHKKTISILGMSSILGYALTRDKKTPAEIQGVTRLNYDAQSMTTSVVRTEQRMTTNNRSWARDGPIKMIKLITSNVNSEDLRTKVAKAVLPVTFCPLADLTSGCQSGYIFVLSSQVIVVNKHYLVSEDKDGNKFLRDTAFKLEDGREIVLLADDMVEVVSSEAVLVNCSDFPTFENLSKFLPKHLPPMACFDGIYVPTGERVVVKGENISLKGGYGDYPAMSCKLETTKGDCGNILLGEVNGNTFIAGMLFAGLAGEQHTTYFTGIGAQEHPSCRVVIPEPADLGPLDPGSEISNDPHEALYPLGTNPTEGKQGFRTAFRETRLYPYLKDKLSEPFYYPTKIAGNVSTDPKVYVHGSAWKNTFAKFDLMNYASHSLLGVCAVEYISTMPKEGPLAPLTLEQAFFGAPEIGVEGFPMKTSAGPFWRKFGCKTKQDLFVENPNTGLYEILPTFRLAVQKGLDALEEGVVIAPHVELAAKDEVRPERKLREYKVRLFSVVDADYNVLVRMYVMPLVVYLLKHKYASECFGQMHAASKQWTDLKNYLTEPGFTKFADMDFSSFDTCHDSKIFRAVSNVMFLLALHVGYSEKDALKVKYLVESMSVQLCQYKGDYFVKTKGMPSGVILTLIINSVANSLLMRVVFCSLTGKPVSEFRKHVRLATVGDDNIHSFSDEVSELFTMVKAAPIYSKLGYTITPASKSGDFVDYMALEDLTFVKRRFVLWDDGFYRAPLDKDSIYKAFCFETKRGLEGSVERLRSVYTSGVYEAYLHGREFFDRFVEEMSSLYREHDLPFDTISFEELNDKFLRDGIETQFA